MWNWKYQVGLATALDAGQRLASFSPADAGRTTGSRIWDDDLTEKGGKLRQEG